MPATASCTEIVPETLEQARRLQTEAAGRMNDGIPGAKEDWDRHEAAIQDFEKRGRIAGQVDFLATEKAEAQRKAFKLALLNQNYENVKTGEKAAKARGAKVDKAVSDLAREIRELMKAHREVRENTALIMGRSSDSADYSSTIEGMIARQLVLAGVPLRGIERDFSTPTIAEIVDQALSSVVGEAKKHHMRITQELTP